MMGFGLIFIVLFWGVVILGAIWLGRFLLNRNENFPGLFAAPKEESPREILNRRYACGEITRDEFERMKMEIE